MSYQLSAFGCSDRLAAFPSRRLRPVTRAVVLGVVAGMRSQLPLALLALAMPQGRGATCPGSSLALLRSPVARGVLGLAAGGELTVDKLPFVPSRNEPGPLIGRMVCGGVAGAALAYETEWSAIGGALVGTIAAGLAAVGAYHLRAAAGRATGLPDPLVGGIEDALAAALGLWAVRAG